MSDEYFETAIKRIKQLRGNMSYKEFTEKTNIPKSTQDSWVKEGDGFRKIGIDSAISIAKYFNITLDWLFGLTDEIVTDINDNNQDQMCHEIKVPKNFDCYGFISTENYIKLLHIIVHKLGFKISTTQDGTVTLSSTNKHLYRFFQDTKDIYWVSDLLPIINQHYNNDNFIVYQSKLMTEYDREIFDKRIAYVYADLECDADENKVYGYFYRGESISEVQYNGMIMEREDEFDRIYGRLQL